MIDGGRVDFAKDSEFFQKIQSKSIHFINSITYAPYTNAAMHAIFSGTYGNRTGTNSYWSTYSFKKEKFKTLTEYLAAENYYTCADIVSELVIPQQGFNEFLVHNEENDDLISKHCNFFVIWSPGCKFCVDSGNILYFHKHKLSFVL